MALVPKIPTIPKKEDKLTPAVKPHQIKRCVCCGTEYSRATDFYNAPNTMLYCNNSGRLPVCRGCIDDLFDRYQKMFDADTAIRRICMKFDLYYSPTLVEASKEMGAYKSRMSAYIAKLNLNAYDGKTYDSTIREEEDLAIQSYEDLETPTQTTEFQVSKELINTWGLNFTASEYEFLQCEYEDWLAKCVVKGKPKQSLVKDLCVLKLQQNKALECGKIDVYQKLTDTYQKTLDRAELTPKIESANDKFGEIPLGVMIKNFEEHDPIMEPLPEWKDVDGCIKLNEIYYRGHMCSMMGIKNPHAKYYEEEMNKYRVSMPELADADTEDVFDAIIRKAMDGNDGDSIDVEKINSEIESAGDS